MEYSTHCSLSALKNQEHPSKKQEFSKYLDQVYPVLDEHRLLSNLWIVFRLHATTDRKELIDEVELLVRLSQSERLYLEDVRGLERDP